MPQIDLLEGERYPEKPVQCSAFANPPPTYYWTFNPSAVATEMATGGKHRVGGQGSPATYEEIDGQTIVGMGPRLMLNMSTMSATIGQGGGNLDGNYNYMKQLSLEEVAKSNARIAHEQQTSIGSTVGPSLFRASRMQSGNYTCVARNKHGVVTVTMAINVFCEYSCDFCLSSKLIVTLCLQSVPSASCIACTLPSYLFSPIATKVITSTRNTHLVLVARC